MESWHKYKTKTEKANITILGNKTLLRYFRKLNSISINEYTVIIEYHYTVTKLPCLPLSSVVIAFHISHSLKTKEHIGSEILFPRQRQVSTKNTILKTKVFNHRISFDTKTRYHHHQGKFIHYDLFRCFYTLTNIILVPLCNTYYAYTTIYYHWSAKLELLEIFVTNNGTEFIKNEIVTLCH